MKKKILLSITLLCFISMSLTGCRLIDAMGKLQETMEQKSEKEDLKKENKPQIQLYDYNLGDEIYIESEKGNYSLSITNIEETFERNQFSDKKADRVIIIDYSYENESYETIIGDFYSENLFIDAFKFKLYDAEGNLMDTYPANIKFPQAVTKGHKTTAQLAYILNNPDNYIEMEYTDTIFNDKDFTIELRW